MVQKIGTSAGVAVGLCLDGRLAMTLVDLYFHNFSPLNFFSLCLKFCWSSSEILVKFGRVLPAAWSKATFSTLQNLKELESSLSQGNDQRLALISSWPFVFRASSSALANVLSQLYCTILQKLLKILRVTKKISGMQRKRLYEENPG